MSRNNNKIFFYIILILLTFGVFQIIRNYISIILLSICFVIMVHPFYSFLLKRWKFSKINATLVSVTLSLIVITLPLVFITNSLVQEGIRLLTSLNLDITSQASINDFIDRLNNLISSIPGVHYTLTLDQIVSTFESIARPILSNLVNTAISFSATSVIFLTNVLIFLLIVFLTLPALPELTSYIRRLSPFGPEIDTLYFERTVSMVKAMVKGTIFISLVLAVIGTVALALTGVQYLIILFILMFAAGVLPVVGSPMVTVPVAIWMLLNGNLFSAIFILFVQFVVMTAVDNILRTTLVAREASLHPILLILGVVGGVNLFGWIGFIFGPVVMILFVTSLEIYQKYYHPNREAIWEE